MMILTWVSEVQESKCKLAKLNLVLKFTFSFKSTSTDCVYWPRHFAKHASWNLKFWNELPPSLGLWQTEILQFLDCFRSQLWKIHIFGRRLQKYNWSVGRNFIFHSEKGPQIFSILALSEGKALSSIRELFNFLYSLGY